MVAMQGMAMGQAARSGEGTGTARMALIDGLRALAAIAVLFYHYMHFAMTGPDRGRYVEYLAYQPFRPWLALLYDYGFYAVEIFWMISGFVFAAVYFARDADTREFAVNRLARLYPLHMVTLLAVTGLQALALSRLGYTLFYDNYDLAHFARQLVFASDWVEAGGHSFNGPIWSVSVEVTVYALFWILRDPLRRMGAAGLAAVIGLCLLANVFGTVSRIPTCAFYFFCGTAQLRLHAWLGRREGLRVALLAGAAIVGAAGLSAGGAFAREVIALPFLAGAAILALAAIEHRADTAARCAVAGRLYRHLSVARPAATGADGAATANVQSRRACRAGLVPAAMDRLHGRLGAALKPGGSSAQRANGCGIRRIPGRGRGWRHRSERQRMGWLRVLLALSVLLEHSGGIGGYTLIGGRWRAVLLHHLGASTWGWCSMSAMTGRLSTAHSTSTGRDLWHLPGVPGAASDVLRARPLAHRRFAAQPLLRQPLAVARKGRIALLNLTVIGQDLPLFLTVRDGHLAWTSHFAGSGAVAAPTSWRSRRPGRSASSCASMRSHLHRVAPGLADRRAGGAFAACAGDRCGQRADR
ncbi:MAG: acyltransferase [Novosphingobium sp.]